MADVKTEKQKVQEITEKLEQGIKELFESEKYKNYLNTMSKFHNYSFNNTVLIAMQKPDATLVAGFKAWKRNFQRHVKKGEKGIRILAPAPYKLKEEQEKLDPETKEIMLDAEGKPIVEEVEITIPAFRAVSVFDVAQTEGKELPELEVKELSDSVEDYENFMQALTEVSPVPIEFEEIEGGAKGYFSQSTHRIAIQEGMSQSQTLKTAIHEVAHAKLHDRELNKGIDDVEHKGRSRKEVEAESVAYTVCQHFGIDTSDYSFGYIAGWSSGREMTELKASLDTIRRTASEIITGIEHELSKVQERTVEQEHDRSLDLIAETDVIVRTQGSMGSDYEIDRITNMSFTQVRGILQDMALLDKETWDGNVQAYLEQRGVEFIPIKASDGLNEEYPSFFDLQYDFDSHDVTEISEFSMMKQAENLINRLEFGKTIFSPDERDLIVNYAYKMGDMDKTKELAYYLADYEENSPNLVAQTVINAQAEIDALPDAMVGLSEMHDYGYKWEEMLPLTKEKAAELFKEDVAVYQLHVDGSETVIEDVEELEGHGGLFGIEKGDWERYVERQSMREELEESSTNKEAQLLYGRDNQFGIYQLNNSPQARDIHFMNSDFLEMKGIAVARENYDLIYTAPLEEGTSLEDIFTRFNIDRPEDFRGHSLSVSDVVVLHQNGENTCHFVDSFGYKEVPEFIQEQQTERTSVIEETTEILEEIAKEHDGEEPERENAVFLVNYNEWREVGELDLGQNYFAIDDPYGDGDFRLLWLQNTVKDITPVGVQYDTYEEAAQALYEKEHEVANLTHNKENNIGSYMVNGREQLERIMEARALQKHMDMVNDKVSYYVIEDLSTWAENSPNRSELERFDSFTEALEKFKAYREKDAQFNDDKVRTTLGFNVHGSEFDVIHARNNENVLSLDFTHSSETKHSVRFMDDLQILCNELVDKVRVHREMSPEEVKDFVKKRFEHHLHSSGIDDASMYMSRFDTLYEQGKMEHLMPTASQKHIVEDIPLERWDNPYFSLNEPEQMAFAVKDKFVSIQTCTEGYDYSIYHADYSLFDGGVYDNPDISIHAALRDILEDIGAKRSDLIPVDYDELTEKAEAVEQATIEEKRIVSNFREKTKEMFHEINGQTPEDVEQTAYAYIKSKIDECEVDAEIVDVIISGSRCRGLESENSDIDIVVEYKGSEHEDTLFNAFHEDGLTIGGVKVDINPITEGKTGTLATYLPGVESYLAEKKAFMEKETVKEQEQEEKKTIVKLSVAECGEFYNMGEYHEGIASVDEALAIFHQIPTERMNGIPSIGINVHTEGTESYQDTTIDIVSGKVADLEVLDYVPDITDDPKAIEMITELIDKLPDIEVRGSLEKWQASILATQIDQFSYDYDTYQYRDTVEDREAQVANIMEDIRNGNTGYLNDFLNAVIAECIRDGITDIFGQGTPPDDSEAVQTVRKAQELLDKLSAYKPLAKVEELEENNYNMIDNVLNNDSSQKEEKRVQGRISVKEKLAEKKAIIEQRDKGSKTMPEKDTEKKNQREI